MSACARSRSGRISRKAPSRRANGVRMASRITGSDMVAPGERETASDGALLFPVSSDALRQGCPVLEELQRGGIQTVAQPGRRRTVRKHMAKVRVAAAAADV